MRCCCSFSGCYLVVLEGRGILTVPLFPGQMLIWTEYLHFVMELYLHERHLFPKWKYTAPLRNLGASGCCNEARVARQRVIHYFGGTEMRDSNPSIKLCGHSMRWRFNGYCSWCWNIWSNKLLFVSWCNAEAALKTLVTADSLLQIHWLYSGKCITY